MSYLMKSQTQAELIQNILLLLIYVILMTFFLRFLWNHSLVPHVTILKPVDSLWHTFVLAVALAAFKV